MGIHVQTPDPKLEIELVQRARRGDQDALRTIIDRYLPTITWFFSGNPRLSPLLVDELTWETFEEAHRSFSSFRYAKSLKNWLLQIARRTYTRWLRKEFANQRRQEGFIRQGASVSPSKNTTALKQFVGDVLDTLPRSTRELLYMRYFKKMTIAEIQDELGASQSVVRAELDKARLMFRRNA